MFLEPEVRLPALRVFSSSLALHFKGLTKRVPVVHLDVRTEYSCL